MDTSCIKYVYNMYKCVVNPIFFGNWYNKTNNENIKIG